MKLYSYQRWSSAVQADGTSKARQSHAAEQYAKANNLELVEIVDAGISGFKSVNSKSGALAQFLEAVDAGLIIKNSYLYVESLDRITRDEIDIALELFMGILRRGITIVTGMDNKIYTHAGIKGNPIDLLTSILLFTRAHEESKTKQQRTNGNALALIRRFQEGLPTTIKSIGSHPWWIDSSTDKFEAVRKHPILWKCAYDAVNLFLEGKSVFKVTKYLNDTYPHVYKGKSWSIANVRKLRFNKAVYGTREITVDSKLYVLEKYYPALISEGQFLRLEKIRETTKYIGKVGEQTNNINLLSGMKIFRCGHCGGTMMAMRHNDTIRYLCEKGRGYNHDCKTWSLPGILVEHTLMLVTTIAYINIQRKGGITREDYSHQISSTEELIADIGTKISRMTKLVSSGLGDIDEVINEMTNLDKVRKQYVMELEVLQRKQLLSHDNSFEQLMMDFFTYAQYGVLQDPVHEYRNKLRDIVYSSIGEVKAWKVDRRLMISFQIKGDDEYYTFSAGDEPYNYIFYYGSPVQLGEDLTVQGTYELPEEVKRRIRDYSDVYEATMTVLNTAHEMLQVINYPPLDGRLFWPRK
ncbi:recombinase family protein [Raoultella ornithinolytica]|uniref:Recombinase family protein n=2 Tax=Klebsiella/Raoultella group TaxID=2890311 RepID=A0A9Q9J9I4_RAOOR|nr:recombinase family protein [Raoultella ornithinolytica]HBY2477280.1 recombinase family protein [Klebsiella pneumoniae]HDT5885596.1 recombinase family protein [Klebsiella pneumoniae subsp. pneumoniae]UXE36466.1 recombinase family protein [Raoultella ornithinolytica]HDT5929632.1 recombinase family protein [Klebsiella pneumoniae subsp. pneumoniae]HDT6023209.1 recombinase family protein [Klebsiella pneumoniae subsp. pneumoniae]